MSHGLKHEGYTVVVDAGDGLFLRLGADGKVNIAKYTRSDAHAGEAPVWEKTLEAERWAEAVVALTPLPEAAKPEGAPTA